MQLILAIVADQQQAAQLAALLDGRLSVDLVQAAEVGEGLLALEDRIPDLILTSPLMSPFDDGVLDEYLRDLGPAGAHVQSLRIPVLSQAPKKTPRLGFSLRRRPKPEARTLDGCEPKVFADEIAQYLARAAEEKSHAATSDTARTVERHVVEEDSVAPPIGEEEWTPAYGSDAVAESAGWTAPEPEPELDVNGWRSDLLDRPPVEEDLEDEPPVHEPALVEAAEDTPVATPALVETVEQPPAVTATTVALVDVAPIEAAIVEAPIVTSPVVTRPDVAAPPVAVVSNEDPHSKATPSFKAALAAIRAAWGKPSSRERPSDPPQEALAAARHEPVVPVTDGGTPLEADLTGEIEVLGATDAPDVHELSVEPDMTEPDSELSAPPLPEPSGDRRRKPAKRAHKAAKAKSPRPPQPQAAQDEWGIFDPNRCGFAAVVDKLDEVADDKVEQPHSGKGRVISLS